MPRLRAKQHHNLPAHRVRLIGRDQDLAVVQELVWEAEGRLVTLTGTGGCGKTQLALEVAAGLVPSFRDGVWFVDLAPVREQALVPYAVADAVGCRERAGVDLVETLVTHLACRQALVVLDNCEHLIDACAGLVERVLGTCLQLRVLTTSREPLRVAGELMWRVPSLAVPDASVPLATPDLLMACPAVQLFVERTHAVQPGFNLSAQNAQAVAGICQRLEGLPLALELAAARVRVLSAQEILEHLDDTFRLLTGGSRTAPTRQQTLRATLDWSFGLLSAAERAAFARLAVFVGGWQLEAAETVCADGTSILSTDVLDVLTGLVDRSLVVVDEQDGRTRYRFLEPVRQYAREQLRSRGESPTIRRRHAEYFHDYGLAQERDASVGGPGRQAATDALAREYANFQAAMQWCIEASQGQMGLEIAWALQFLWKSRGPFGEGVLWITRLLTVPDAAEPTPARAVALVTAGRLESLRGNRIAARTFFAEGVPLSRQTGDPWILFVALADAGFDALPRGDFAEAQVAFEEALTTTRSNGDRIAEALTLNNLSQLATFQTQYALGAELGGEALHLARALGDPLALGAALAAAGWAALGLGDFSEARRLGEECLNGPDVVIRANALEMLGLAALAEGHPAEAGARLAGALRLRQQIGSQAGIAWVLHSLAVLAAHRGHAQQALRLDAAAEVVREASGTCLYPMRRAWRDRWLSPLELTLGPDRVSSIRAEGRALSTDEAVNLALTEAQQASNGVESPPSLAGVTSVSPLTPRQQEVAILVAEGLTNQQIAERLVVTERAVASHIEHILDRLAMSSRTQIAVWVAERGLHAPTTAT